MKKIGLVGGLSWVSTLEYYRLINTYVREKLGGHRSAHIIMESLDEGEFLHQLKADSSEKSCEQMMVDAFDVLVRGQAEIFALCANGLHRFEKAIKDAHGIDIVHIAEATALVIQAHGFNQVGLIGVKQTMEGMFYKDRLTEFGINTLIPNDSEREHIQNKIVSELVLNDFREDTKEYFTGVIERLASVGSQAVILACTEIPLLIKANEVRCIQLFSTTDIHCSAIVEKALA